MENPEAAEVEFRPTVQLQENSENFIKRWNGLISTTNWQKGEIIVQWRASLQEQGASQSDFSDEAWSQLVGGVTSQHTGRLRRTFERFGHVYQEYQGIYWSHFYAALDWDDAEMWLEGAIQNKWSVSRMRNQRWETLGQLPDQRPQESDIVASEIQEEHQSLELSERKRQHDRDYIEGPVYEGPDFGDQDGSQSGSSPKNAEAIDDFQPTCDDNSSGGEGFVPEAKLFEAFDELPEDVEEATAAFKLAIIRHRTEQWQEISQQDMISLLMALQKLAEQSNFENR